jgi:hypothetical protein
MIIKHNKLDIFDPLRKSKLGENKFGKFNHIIMIANTHRGNNSRKRFLLANDLATLRNRRTIITTA